MITMSLSEADYNIALDEIQKQREILLKMDDSLDTKISIILGFTFVVIAQILLKNDLITLVVKDNPHIIVFALGFVFIICSVCLGIIAYSTRAYRIGPNIFKLSKQYPNEKLQDFDETVLEALDTSLCEIIKVHQNKAKYVKCMFRTFFIGVPSIIVIGIIYFSKIW